MDEEKRKRKSLLFSNGDLQAIDEVSRGDRSDKMGIFYTRTVPKIMEMFKVWFPKRRMLLEMICPMRRNKGEQLEKKDTEEENEKIKLFRGICQTAK